MWESSVFSMEMLKQKCVAGKVWSAASVIRLGDQSVRVIKPRGGEWYRYADGSTFRSRSKASGDVESINAYAPHTVNLYNLAHDITVVTDPDRYWWFPTNSSHSEEGYTDPTEYGQLDFVMGRTPLRRDRGLRLYRATRISSIFWVCAPLRRGHYPDGGDVAPLHENW